MNRPQLRVLASTALFALLITACAGGANDRPTRTAAESGTGAAARVTADFVLRDAAVNELRSFSAIVSALELVDDEGVSSGNLIAGPIEVELLRLRELNQWLSRVPLPFENFAGLRLAFLPGSYSAATTGGARVQVDSLGDELVVPVVAPIAMQDATYMRFVVDVDLANSLTGDASEGRITFDPVGSTNVSDGALGLPLLPFYGRASKRDAARGRLGIDAFAGALGGVSVGAASMHVDDSTLLVLATDVAIASPAYFFTFMTPGATLVDVHASLGREGQILPYRLEIEDQNGIAGGVFPVRITGRIRSVSQNLVIDVEIHDIVRGRVFVEDYLNRIGNPPSLSMSISPQLTLAFEGNRLVDAAALQAGDEVDLKFRGFQGQPLLVDRVSITGWRE